MASYDVIVIGSGIGGLSAALTCARKGRNVLVLEGKQQFGGYINPFQRKHYWFDTGIHYIGECGPGQSLHRHFERMGLMEELSFRELDPDGFDRFVFPDYEVSMCKGIDAYRDRLVRDFPHETRGLDRFFDLLRKVDVLVAAGAGVRSPKALARVMASLPGALRYHLATYAEVLDDFVRDPRLRAVLAAQGGDLGLPPGRASGLIMLALKAHFLGGAYFPEGGTKGVRDAFVKVAEKRGVALVRNTPVERILTRNGRAVGVRTAKGEEHEASIVISNADAATTYGRLLGREILSRRMRKKLDGAAYSVGSLLAFVGTDLDPTRSGMTDANVWHYPSYDIDALYAPTLAGELGEQTPFFTTVPTLKDPRGGHAPEGKHTVELITFAPWQAFERWKDQRGLKRDADYQSLKHELGMNLVRRAEAHLPGLSDHIEVLEVSSPLTNDWFVGTTRGAIYGLEHTPAQIGLGRFRTVGALDGLYLCGADVIGAGISPCVNSGVMAGAAALMQPTALGRAVRSVNRKVQRAFTPAPDPLPA